MEILFAIAIATFFAWAGHKIASGKNRNAVLWAVLCGIFGVIPIIVIALLSPVEPENPVRES